MVLVNSSGLHPHLLFQILICMYLPCVPSALLCAGSVCMGIAAPGGAGQEPSWFDSCSGAASLWPGQPPSSSTLSGFCKEDRSGHCQLLGVACGALGSVAKDNQGNGVMEVVHVPMGIKRHFLKQIETCSGYACPQRFL